IDPEQSLLVSSTTVPSSGDQSGYVRCFLLMVTASTWPIRMIMGMMPHYNLSILSIPPKHRMIWGWRNEWLSG
ncbi:mCG1043129, partial [Mus musculus]